MELETQYTTAFLLSMAGAVLGAVYDIYRTSLREWRFLRRFSALFDIAFWIFGLLFVFTLLLGVNDGDVRIVTFVLLAIGYGVYYGTAHPLIVASTKLVVRTIYRVVVLLIHMSVVVFVRPLIWLWRVLCACVGFTDKVLSRMERVLIWPVWQGGRLLRKIFTPIVQKGKELRYALSKKMVTILMAWLGRLRQSAPEDAQEHVDQTEAPVGERVAPNFLRRILPWVAKRRRGR